jgi:hypothetical protein
MIEFPFDTVTLIAIPRITLCAYIILGISSLSSALVTDTGYEILALGQIYRD